MPGRGRPTLLVVLVLSAWGLVVPAANAYIDPGSGSMIIQAVAAVAMTVALTARIWWRRIVSLLRVSRRGADDSSEG
jgi:hypothetical protein